MITIYITYEIYSTALAMPGTAATDRLYDAAMNYFGHTGTLSIDGTLIERGKIMTDYMNDGGIYNIDFAELKQSKSF